MIRWHNCNLAARINELFYLNQGVISQMLAIRKKTGNKICNYE